MRDGISDDVAAAFASGELRGVLLLEFYFDSGTAYYTSAAKNIAWGGNTYVGIARIGKVDPIVEGTQVQMYGMAVAISHIPNSAIAQALSEAYQGRKCIMRVAVLDTDHVVIMDPVIVFRGQIDQMKVTLGAQQSAIAVTVNNRMSAWDQPKTRRFNNQDQIEQSPTDTFFFQTDQIAAGKQLPWGVQ